MRAPTACRRTVSGSISLFCPKCFSPFPHGTGSLSVSREYLALPDGPGRFTQGSTCPALLRMPLRFTQLRIRSFHALRPRFPARSARSVSCGVAVLQPRACRNTRGLGFSPFARRYWGNHCCFLFLRVLRCFSSPRWPPPRGFSQLVTSFIASESQGIRRAPLSTYAAARSSSWKRAGIYLWLMLAGHPASARFSLLLVTSCHRTSF